MNARSASGISQRHLYPLRRPPAGEGGGSDIDRSLSGAGGDHRGRDVNGIQDVIDSHSPDVAVINGGLTNDTETARGGNIDRRGKGIDEQRIYPDAAVDLDAGQTGRRVVVDGERVGSDTAVQCERCLVSEDEPVEVH